jgi:predicted amidohydrolase YtcJ
MELELGRACYDSEKPHRGEARMRNLAVATAPAAVIALACPALWASDLILLHGHVYTGHPKQPWGEAIAISGTRIDEVGSNEEVLRRQEPNTKVIDLANRTVIPGIIDSHTHMWFGALALHGFNMATPEVWVEPSDEARLIAKIKDYSVTHPQDKILFGRVAFPMTVSHELLDRAVSDRPVVIHAPTEHSYWVNARALDLAKITDRAVFRPRT